MASEPGSVVRRVPGRRRWPLVVGGAALVLVVGLLTMRYWSRPAPGGDVAASQGMATATITEGPLQVTEQTSGTVRYASTFTIIDQAQGVLTALPAPGQVVAQGQDLYGVDGSPVLLLYGAVPAYRALAPGVAGPDVAELNAALVALGDASAQALPSGQTTYTTATAAAVQRFQARAGLAATGTIPLGEVLFAPQAIRVASVGPALGTAIAPGQVVLQATSSTQEVVVEIDPSQAVLVRAGDAVTITTTAGQTTAGVISAVAKTAQSAASPGGGPPAAPTVEVDIAPKDPASLVSLDNAGVQVGITTATVQDALAVPVTAVLAQAGGGYALEVVGSDGAHQVVPVQLGVFDDGSGTVQVTGSGLAAGQRVVTAGS